MTYRIIQMALAASALLFTPQIAQAQSAALESVVIGDTLEAKRDEYGARDLRALESDLREAIESTLHRAGLMEAGAQADITIAVTLEDAWPNRPTFAQLSARPSLSYQSLSRGGARLSATLSDDQGAVIDVVDYEWRTFDIADSAHRGTWSDAKRTFDRFARRLAEDLPGEAS